MADQKIGPIDREYSTFIMKFYPLNPQNELEKLIESINTLLDQAKNNGKSIEAILETTTKLLHRFFGFGEIAIGLKSQEDGLYRYKHLFGFRKDIAESMLKVAYDHEDMTSQKEFPNIRIGKYSEMGPVEGLPKDEISLFNRPSIIGRKRASFDELLEGDYFDIFIHGNNKELIGWIELSNPVKGKLPSRDSIRWIEMIANISGLIIEKKIKGDRKNNDD